MTGETHGTVRVVVVGGFVLVALFVIAGVAFVYMEATGETEMTVFGQAFRSVNVGIGALFLGALTYILVVRRSLKTIERAGVADKPRDAFHLRIPNGWTFGQTVNAIVVQDNALQELIGFTDKELEAPLDERQLDTATVMDALLYLRLLTKKPNAIREYGVERVGAVYRLKVR